MEKNLKAVTIKSRAKQACSLSPYLVIIVLVVLTREIRILKEPKEIRIVKKEGNVSYFAEDVIVHISDP